MLKDDKTKKREARHKITQEDFTPVDIVNEMLAKLPQETFTNLKTTILDTSCGIGNFLAEALNRKLDNCKNESEVITALKSIYGVELMADNVMDCRERLYKIVIGRFPNIVTDDLLNYRARSIIRNRIKWHDSLTCDYNNWGQLYLTPRKKHEGITFKIYPKAEDTKFPMWYKEKPKEVNQLSLFSDADFV